MVCYVAVGNWNKVAELSVTEVKEKRNFRLPVLVIWKVTDDLKENIFSEVMGGDCRL